MTTSNMPDLADGRVWNDVRDRAAFVHLTGVFPTHLRAGYSSILAAITDHFRQVGKGPMAMSATAIRELHLEDHPMVVEVQRLLGDGWRIVPTHMDGNRRNFWKVYLARRDERMIVQGDGSTKRGW